MRIISRRSSLSLIAIAVLANLLCASSGVHAQGSTVDLGTTTGALVVDGESGTLRFNGTSFSLAIQTDSPSAIGGTATPIIGIVYNLRSPIDIVGKYAPASSGALAASESGTTLLQNAHGIVLRFEGNRSGAPLNLEGLTISMQ